MEWGAAFFLGLLGSLHCVGMCGPLALAVPQYTRGPRWISGAMYHAGRITTYSTLGALFGGMGLAVSWAGGQQSLSLILGLVLILAVVLPRGLQGPRLGRYGQVLGTLKARLRRQLQRHGLLAGFGVGLLNGLLPCGLVYLGLATAMATYTPIQGAGTMLAFGLGTLPLMLSLTTLAPYLSPTRRQRFRLLTPYLVAGMGLLLILRGLDLGIPYLSPALPETIQADIVTCTP